MKIQTPITRTVMFTDAYICDICGKEAKYSSSGFELDGFLNIDFEGGYGSVFGDGNRITCDICQYCLYEIIGDYYKIGIKDD